MDAPTQTEEATAFLVGSDFGLDVFTAASLGVGADGIPTNLLPGVEYVPCTEAEIDEWLGERVKVIPGDDVSFVVVFTGLNREIASTTVFKERHGSHT